MISIEKISQALILAGGEGTRLKPVTEKIPKPMIEVNGRPFLEYQLELLAKNQIRDVVFCIGYLWENIHEHFGDTFISSSGAILKLHYSVEPRLLGTGGAIRNADEFIADQFFIVNGDTYLDIEYQDLGKMISSHDVIGVTTVYTNPDNMAKNNIRMNDQGFVLKYDKQHHSPDLTYLEAGVAVFSNELLGFIPKKIPANQKISLEIDIYPKLISQDQLRGYVTNNRFYDIGTVERLKIISEVLR